MGNTAIESMSEGPLRCFYSQIESLPAISRADALAFHNVVSSIFRQAAVIPIRFPTLLNGEEDLRGFLRKHGEQYSAALERLRDCIQMELHISIARDVPRQAPASGRRYLEERRTAMQSLAAAAEQAHGRIQHLASAWRIRAGNRPDMLRCYALLPRVAEKDFRHQIQSLAAPDSIKIILSGPWPCSEFLE